MKMTKKVTMDIKIVRNGHENSSYEIVQMKKKIVQMNLKIVQMKKIVQMNIKIVQMNMKILLYTKLKDIIAVAIGDKVGQRCFSVIMC